MQEWQRFEVTFNQKYLGKVWPPLVKSNQRPGGTRGTWSWYFLILCCSACSSKMRRPFRKHSHDRKSDLLSTERCAHAVAFLCMGDGPKGILYSKEPCLQSLISWGSWRGTNIRIQCISRMSRAQKRQTTGIKTEQFQTSTLHNSSVFQDQSSGVIIAKVIYKSRQEKSLHHNQPLNSALRTRPLGFKLSVCSLRKGSLHLAFGIDGWPGTGAGN